MSLCSSEASDYEGGSERVEPSERETNERTSLLPPSGISTNEHDHQRHHEPSQQRSSQTQESHPRYQESGSTTLRMDNTTATAVLGNQVRSLEMTWTSYLFEQSLTISLSSSQRLRRRIESTRKRSKRNALTRADMHLLEITRTILFRHPKRLKTTDGG